MVMSKNELTCAYNEEFLQTRKFKIFCSFQSKLEWLVLDGCRCYVLKVVSVVSTRMNTLNVTDQ